MQILDQLLAKIFSFDGIIIAILSPLFTSTLEINLRIYLRQNLYILLQILKQKLCNPVRQFFEKSDFE